MIKMSTRSTYAIRALTFLARGGPNDQVRLSVIAETQGIPLPYLEQIFSKLKKAGLVKAVRGPQGGYKLAKEPDRISLADIVNTLEGPQQPVLCSMPENRSPDCHKVDGCMSRILCCELDGEISRVLSKNNLGTLCREAERLSQSHNPKWEKVGVINARPAQG